MPTPRAVGPARGVRRSIALAAATIGYAAAYLALVAAVYAAGWLVGLV